MIKITKRSGEQELFDPGKLRRSLTRSGAKTAVIDYIISSVTDLLYDGISTKEIYKMAFAMLRKEKRPMAARFKLKEAVRELGPSGFPFERFVGAMLRSQGYSVKIGQSIQGHCVQHEVDVVAETEDHHFAVECKFHSDAGRRCDVKVPLYIDSRFRDIRKNWEKLPGHSTKFHQGWVVTNTRFTTDAIDYGVCAGMHLVSWDFPQSGSLREMIETSGLHPVTCLTTLKKAEKSAILDAGIVLCKELCERPQLLQEMGLSLRRQSKVLEEARELCIEKIMNNV